jgi:WD40 repeat protein
LYVFEIPESFIVESGRNQESEITNLGVKYMDEVSIPKQLNSLVLQHLGACSGVSAELLEKLRESLVDSHCSNKTELLQIFHLAYEGLLHVNVSTLGGQAHELDVDVGTTIAELKAMLETKLEIPAREQRLVLGGRILDDAVLLVSRLRPTLESSTLALARVKPNLVLTSTESLESWKLTLWDMDSGEAIQNFPNSTGAAIDVVADSKSMRAVTASTMRVLEIWDLESGNSVQAIRGLAGCMRAVSVDWNVEQPRILVGFEDGSLQLLSLLDGSLLQTYCRHMDEVLALETGWQCGLALSASADASLLLWNLDQDSPVLKLAGHRKKVWDVACDWSSMQAISCSSDGSFRKWDLVSGCCTRVLCEGANWITAMAVDWGSNRVVGSSAYQALTVWDSESGEQIQTLDGVYAEALAVQWETMCAVTVTPEGRVEVWDFETGERQRILDHGAPAFLTLL